MIRMPGTTRECKLGRFESWQNGVDIRKIRAEGKVVPVRCRDVGSLVLFPEAERIMRFDWLREEVGTL
jgi:hypothetical protein